jgi:type II secretion system protein C
VDKQPYRFVSRKSPRRAIVLGVGFAIAASMLSVTLFSLTRFDPAALWNQWKGRSASRHSIEIVDKRTPTSVVEPQPIGTDSSVSRTPLNLLLSATQPGRNAHEGHALIGVSARSPQTYRAGALLANGTRVQEIYKDYVVLERDGQTSHLYVSGRQPPESQPNLNSMIMVGGASATPTAVADSHDSLTDYIRAVPTFDGDAFQGLIVYANQRSDAFFRLGLQEGDVITSVDGTNLVNQQSAMAALRPLSKGQALTVTVQRAGRQETLSLDGSLLL